jgi:hypothetical protein
MTAPTMRSEGEADPDPRAFYQEAVREGLEHCA